MTWWQTLMAGGGGAGVLGVIGRALQSRKLRKLAAAAISPDDLSRVDTAKELRIVLDEQRKGYEHLATRVDRLETELVRLRISLDEARRRERSLAKQLRDERNLSARRIQELEEQLTEARGRIAALEAQLAEAHAA